MGNKRGASGFGEKALGSVVHMLDFVMSVGIELVLSSRMWVKERDVRGGLGQRCTFGSHKHRGDS